jgi:hypothetical protein
LLQRDEPPLIRLQLSFADSGEEINLVANFPERYSVGQPTNRFQDTLLVAHKANLIGKPCLASMGFGDSAKRTDTGSSSHEK